MLHSNLLSMVTLLVEGHHALNRLGRSRDEEALII